MSEQAIGWGSGDVAENTDWARELSVEYEARMVCRVDRNPSRTNDSTHLLWTVYAIDATPAHPESDGSK